jgi:O-antigen/teichoic acid export membrane protein
MAASHPLSVSTENRHDPYVERLARGVGITSFGQSIGHVLNYATQVALARMYGPVQLGFYVMGFTVIRVADILAQFGLSSGVVRFVAKYRAEDDAARQRGTILLALGTALALSLALATLMFFGAGFLANRIFGEPLLETVFRAFSVSLPFLTVMNIALWATQGFQTMKYTTYVQELQRPLLNLVLVVIFYVMGAEVLGAVVAYVISMVAGTVLALLYLRRVFPRLLDRSLPPRFETRALLGASAPMVVANSMLRVNDWVSVGVMGILATAEAVGIFNAAVRTAAISGIILGAFRIFTPMISDLYNRGCMDHLSSLYQDVSRWAFTGSFAIFLVTVLLAKDIMAVFGPQFVGGWAVLIMLSAAQLFNSSTGHTGRALAMTGHQRVVMLATIGATAIGVIVSVALVPAYGLLGGGIGLTLSTVFLNVVTLLSVKRRLGLWPYNRSYLKPLFAGGLAVTGAYMLKLELPLAAGMPTIYILAPLFLVAYVALLLVLGLSPSDRQVVATFWTSVRHLRPRAAEGA